MPFFVQKTALITGAGGGLGRAIAERFLLAGSNVVICDIDKDRLEEFKVEVSAAYPKCTLVRGVDITNDKALDELFAEAEEVFGHVDFVINSAGRIDKFDPVGDVERGMWDRVIALNLTAPTMVAQRAVKMFLKHGTKGSIVNIGSISSIRGYGCGVAYTASKHGLIGLTKSTAAFYGPKGIRCNAVLPGAMDTNISNSLAAGVNMEGIATMRRFFPEDGGFPICDTAKVAGIVLYLCSEDGEIVNGAAWSADGGATAN